MSTLLYIAAALTIAVGVAHSYLGERYILIRLFRSANMNAIYRNPEFMTRTLRFAWHLTTIAWWGLAAILIAMARGVSDPASIGAIIAVTFLIHFAIAVCGSRARHLSWPLFLAIATLIFYATR